jgi:hypothetical protein
VWSVMVDGFAPCLLLDLVSEQCRVIDKKCSAAGKPHFPGLGSGSGVVDRALSNT